MGQPDEQLPDQSVDPVTIAKDKDEAQPQPQPQPTAASGDNRLKIDYGFLNRDGLKELRCFVDETPTPPALPAGMSLLPGDADWAAKSVHLPLCEFLAYKSAIAYNTADEIETNLTKSCSGISHFKFFDSRLTDRLDTQGYGFFFDGRAFIIMRGSESDADWASNRDDKVTAPRKFVPPWNKENARLHTPGQHRGFAKGWAAVRSQIEAWLKELPEIAPGEKRSFMFSGHSLGGALAIIGAYEFQKYHADRDVAAVVTFGAPMVGNAAFAKEYETVLGSRTVRLESSGDIVPKIMGRWYYRLHQRARKWIEARVDAKMRPEQSSFYQAVGETWGFDKTPLLKRSQFDAVLAEVARRAAEALKRQAEKTAEDSADSQTNGQNEPVKDEASQDAKSRSAASEMSEQSAVTEPVTTAKDGPGGGGMGNIIFLVVGVVVVAVVGGFVYWHVRRKFTGSHDIQQRYALYLSTLSYQRLRDLHDGDVELANEDLDRHLQFIRGKIENEPEKKPVFGPVADLPVRFSKDDDLDKFLGESTSYII